MGGTCLLDIQIQAVQAVFKNYDIIICVGAEPKRVYDYVREYHKNKNIRIVENQLFQNSNSCESLRLCINNTDSNNLFIMEGDVLISHNNIYDIDIDKSFIITQDSGNDSGFEVGVSINSNNVENLQYGIENHTWAGVAHVKGVKQVEELRTCLSAIDFKNKFLFEALNSNISKGHKMQACQTDWGRMVKVNTAKTLRRVQWDYDNGNRRLFQ
jgi:choline kinase